MYVKQEIITVAFLELSLFKTFSVVLYSLYLLELKVACYLLLKFFYTNVVFKINRFL